MENITISTVAWYSLSISNYYFVKRYIIPIFIHLKLCLATATHNFKCVQNIYICLIWDQTFEDLDA